ncbi:MAG: RsmB/NOP family class I SAM-dependent RNA methyltransferase [Saprospiraceae bacterium]|nr:RsmB/NOP family class I SAM-dependent RNA methyltransferase [Saprospiraceae bacterium]
MKFHYHLTLGVVEAVKTIFFDHYHADKVIERSFKAHLKWGSRDRAFFAESVYDIVRNWRLLDEANPVPDITDPTEKCWIIVGIYFIIQKQLQLPDWSEWSKLNARVDDIPLLYNEKIKIRAIRYSIPDWIDTKGMEAFGEAQWEKEIKKLNEPAQVVLRTNTLKINTKSLKRNLFEESKIETTTIANGDALIVTKRQNIFQTKAFKNGWFEVQDWGSQQIAPFLDVAPSMRVVDACAGAGGKTLHLASLMNNKGKIIALDIEEKKLIELERRCKRNGVNIVETRNITSMKVIKRLYDSADRLLLDVPCSGLGVLRRNPDAKWKLSEEFIHQIQTTQADILDKYAPICKIGGLMVYATCSILPSENELQVQNFISRNEGKFKLLKSSSLTPHDFGFDGFYMALLERLA